LAGAPRLAERAQKNGMSLRKNMPDIAENLPQSQVLDSADSAAFFASVTKQATRQ
jgi:hypothetical protein